MKTVKGVGGMGILLSAALIAACSSGGGSNIADVPPLALKPLETQGEILQETEPNNTAQDANRVTATESLFGTVEPGVDDVDVYTFALTQAREYRFNLIGAGAFAVVDTETGERVESQDGTLVASLVAEREYLIEVSGNATGDASQDYEVELFRRVRESPADRCEPGEICP